MADTTRSVALLVAVVAVAAVVAAAGAPAVAASEHATLSVDDATVTTGETTTVAVTLSELPNGLSGFNVTLALSNPDSATITDARIDGFELNRTTVSPDRSAVELKGIDTQKRQQSGDGPLRLATVTIHGDDTTGTDLTLQVDQVDDDEGDRIDPTTEDSRLTVDDDGSGAGDDADRSDSDTGSTATTTVESGDDTPSSDTEENGSDDEAEGSSGSDGTTDGAPTSAADGDDNGDTAESRETTSTTSPGFGVSVAVTALLATTLLARRR